MTEPQHTPGPWRAHVMTTGYLIKQEPGHGGRRVAGLRMAESDSGFANACLMATAPDLLAALKAARSQLVTLGGDPRGNVFGDVIQASILNVIDAAITKAEGRS